MMVAGWKTMPLVDVATLQRGFDLPVQDRVPGSVPVFAANGTVGTHAVAKIQGPGVVTGRSGSIGKVHYVDGDYWPLNTALFVKDFHGNHPRYVYYLLQEMRLENYHEGTGVPTLNRNNVHAVPVPVPPLDEQRRIAEVLDRAEALRAKRRAALTQLDTLTQSIFLDLFGDPLANTRNWPTAPIGDVCSLIVDCVNRTAPLATEPTPFKMIRTTNVRNGVVDLSEVRYVAEETFNIWNRRTTPQRGDVLLTREAPVGEAGILSTNDRVFLGQRLMLYRPDPRKVSSEYLLHSFRGPFLQQQFERGASGTTVKHLPLPVCRSFEVRLPPIDMQQEFSLRAAAVERLKSAQRRSLAELDALFASLQHRAFRGEL